MYQPEAFIYVIDSRSGHRFFDRDCQQAVQDRQYVDSLRKFGKDKDCSSGEKYREGVSPQWDNHRGDGWEQSDSWKDNSNGQWNNKSRDASNDNNNANVEDPYMDLSQCYFVMCPTCRSENAFGTRTAWDAASWLSRCSPSK